MTLVVLFLGVVGLMLLRVPVAFSLLIPSGLYILFGDSLTVSMVTQRVTAGINSFALLAVPLFVMTGILANESGVTERIFRFATDLLGHLRGSLGYVNIGASLVFSWMSGAGVADVAGLGRIEVAAMIKRGYQPRFSAGLTAASSVIGPIMPPSIPAIIYAVSAGVSVGAMFLAGIGPAFLIVAVLSVVVYMHARKHPELRLPRAKAKQVLRSFLVALPPLLTPVVIIGGILSGVFTPTEAAGAAVIYLLVVGIVYRDLSVSSMSRILRLSAETTGSIMLIVGAATLFGWVITIEGAPAAVASWLGGITDSPAVFMFLVVLILLALGTFLEPTSAILILVPVLVPSASALGIHPVHFGTVMILSLMLGLLTPPVGLVLYVLTSVTEVRFSDVVRGTLFFIGPLVLVACAVALLPSLTLWLVEAGVP